ncbi:hypothetical protein BASA81_011985 [Batrachochytrium salamandrivorans]|nr:hypothetical protein BASA81_011985 [Batrachochytrium salamandrivorans]
MPFPVRVRKLELKSYGENCDAEQYNAFIKEETKYFEPKYSSGEILAKDDFGTPFVATRKSDGMKVAYKSIPKSEVYEYALESSPYPICHLRNHLVCSKKQSVEQCISSRQLNLFLPYELMFQTYLSRPGYDNPYVPMTLDYIVLEDECILVMEHFGEKSVTLSSYVKEKGRLDVGEARSIIKEVVDAVRSLKRHDLDQRWLDGTVEHESMGTRHDNQAAGQHGLADFLQVAYRQYQSTLWKYHRDRLVEVG